MGNGRGDIQRTQTSMIKLIKNIIFSILPLLLLLLILEGFFSYAELIPRFSLNLFFS